MGEESEHTVDLNTLIKLIKRPDQSYPLSGSIFQLKVLAPTSTDNVPDHSIIVRNIYISIDRGCFPWIAGEKTQIDPVDIGDIMKGYGIGQVIFSKSKDYKEGDFVFGMLNWQKYSVMEDTTVKRLPDMGENIHLCLGVYGVSGITAWIGLHKVAKIKPGDVVVVTGASGAVGELAIQFAKNHGCKVVGIVSGQDEIAYFNKMNIQGCIDYKTENVSQALKKLHPDGVDVVFDVVGGEMLDTLLLHTRMHSRVVLCGTASRATTNPKSQLQIKNYPQLIFMRTSLIGFDHTQFSREYKEALEDIEIQVKNNQIKYRIKML